jgi:hypothetical protein
MCKIVLLDFLQRLNYKIIKSQSFERWILLSSSGKGRGGVPGLRLAQPGGPTDRLAQPGGPTDRLAQPGGPTDRLAQPGGPTDRLAQPGGPTDRLAQPGGPTERFSVLFRLFCLLTKGESRFRIFVIL